MKAASGTSSSNYLSQAASASSGSGNTATAPEPEDPSPSFDNVLQQQSGGASNAPTTSVPSALSTPSTPVDWQQIVQDLAAKAAAAATPPPTSPAAAAPATTDAASPLPNPAADAQALLKSILAPEAAATASAPGTAPATPTTKNPSIPLYTGASTLMAHAAILAAQARQAAASASTATSPAAPTTSSEATSQTSATLADALGLTLDLAAKTPGKSTGLQTTEKKSDPPPPEGSFLHSDALVDSSSQLLAGLSGQMTAAVGQALGNQSITTHSASAGNSIGALSAGASATGGMANGKKEEQMNATLDIANQFASTGTNPMVMRTSADVNIQLSSNQNFKDALGQVMHVAELSGMSSSTPPLRVAIEIQTPPGAIVNVYVSKQEDGYRAQLSASDPRALSYVQDQISSLRQSTDTGVSVRWLPAQLETSSSVSSSSSSSESGLSWDRGGQGQSGNQQPADDRQQSTRQRRPLFEGVLAPAGSTSYMDAVSAFGSAA